MKLCPLRPWGNTNTGQSPSKQRRWKQMRLFLVVVRPHKHCARSWYTQSAAILRYDCGIVHLYFPLFQPIFTLTRPFPTVMWSCMLPIMHPSIICWTFWCYFDNQGDIMHVIRLDNQQLAYIVFIILIMTEVQIWYTRSLFQEVEMVK